VQPGEQGPGREGREESESGWPEADALTDARQAFAERRYEEAARIASAGESAALAGMVAASLLAAQRPLAAIGAADRAVALAPEEAWPRRLRALAMIGMGKPRDAAAAAAEAVRRAPGDPWALDVMALACAAERRSEEARSWAQRAAAAAPADPDLQRRLSERWLSDDPAAAERFAREAISADPANALAWDRLVMALEQQHRTREAAAARTRAADLEPALRERYQHHGTLRSFLKAGAAVLFLVLVLGVLPGLVRRHWPRTGASGFAVWIVAILLPLSFALGSALLLRRGHGTPMPPDPQLLQVVKSLRAPSA